MSDALLRAVLVGLVILPAACAPESRVRKPPRWVSLETLPEPDHEPGHRAGHLQFVDLEDEPETDMPVPSSAAVPEQIDQLAYTAPVTSPVLISRFGRRHGRFHKGIDIRGRKGGGDPVFAARGGEVMSARRRQGYGNMVVLRHADGWFTRYAHLKEYKTRVGAYVNAGDVIGIVGQTGRATAPHLHFEIIDAEGLFVDPEFYIFGKAE